MLTDLKLVHQTAFEPDSEFIQRLDQKLEKGGEINMLRILEYLKSRPLVFAFGSVLLAVLLVNYFNLPLLPFANNIGIGLPQVSKDEIALKNTSESSGITFLPDKLPSAIPPYYPGEDYDSLDRSMVRSASMDLEVKDVSDSVQKTSDYVSSVGGFVTNSSINKSENGYYAYLTARVPEVEVNKTVAYLRGLALEVKAENISSYDQTSQVKNTETKIADLRNNLATYQGLLNDAKTTEEKLRIQNLITNLERQIQTLEGQEKELKGRAAMSELNINFTQQRFSLPLVGEWGLEGVFRESFALFKQTLRALVTVVIWAIVFCPIWIPIWWLTRRMKQK